jgi:uncharacterized protein YjbJ (UPF0337 family)
MAATSNTRREPTTNGYLTSRLTETATIPRNPLENRRLMMATQNKAANKAQDLKGRLKEGAGRATGNKDLKRKGKSDQTKSAVKDVGEKVKDAASTVKDKLTDR